MYRLACALMICLALTSCGSLTRVTKGQISTLIIPKEYLVKCQRDLPDAVDGSKLAIQENHKDQQGMYHRCADKDDALVDELIKQGVKGS